MSSIDTCAILKGNSCVNVHNDETLPFLQFHSPDIFERCVLTDVMLLVLSGR